MHSKLKHTLVQGSLSEHHNCTKHQLSKKKKTPEVSKTKFFTEKPSSF